ncbi:threonine--tRNA ligase [Halobacillus sp. B23F22_1]|uniref:threonine--tRNA ligase n=1 Tax=Halobacillus sp. B23F22_1 TaxID=3459514 RepID=UPI00373E9DE2
MNEEKVLVKFPDGSQKGYQIGVSLEEIAGSISSSLKKNSVAGKVNGELYDMKRSIGHDAEIELFDLHSPEGLEVMRHSAAHLLAQAVRRLYGDVHLGIGPVVENGFYYDIDIVQSLPADDLPQIEKMMKKIISENLEISREEISRREAEILFAAEPLKLELLQSIPVDEVVSVYRQGEFVDLCRGPHVPSTKYIKAFRLTHVSGAYWRGNSDNQMLQRIYGAAFASASELEEYFHFVEEAKERDHRKLGRQMELFMFSEEAPGMPFYLPNGQVLRNELAAYLRKVQHQYDYEEVRTPIMMNQRLWKQSGHWDHYKENMYFSEVDDQNFSLKPMNCPGHMMIFKDKLHSYRDLPIRMAEFGQVHRHEFSGALNGLLRVRTFCQDDAHIFAAETQVEQEVKRALQLIDEVYSTFGFQYSFELSTRPDDYMGDKALWEDAEQALENVLGDLNYSYNINEGDGAFYGPKIDIHIKDALNRSHQCATVQLDFQMPEKFDLSYVNERNEKVRPVIIHRAVFGSIDRFLGILIEHFGGAFPVWLAPIQVKVIGVSNEVHNKYVQEVKDQLKRAGIRVEADSREEKLGYKIRETQMNKVPYVLVVGDQEMEYRSVNVRKYGQKESENLKLDEFIRAVNHKITARSLKL